MSFHWLRLSPSQCPEYRPWLGKVEREMTKGRFPRIWIKALENNRESWRQKVRAARQVFALSHNSQGRISPWQRGGGSARAVWEMLGTRTSLIHPSLPGQCQFPSSPGLFPSWRL